MTAGNPAAAWGVSVQRPNKPLQNHLYNQITPSLWLPTHRKVLTVLSDSPNNPTTASSNRKMKAEEILGERGSRIHGLICTCAGVWAGWTDRRTLDGPSQVNYISNHRRRNGVCVSVRVGGGGVNPWSKNTMASTVSHLAKECTAAV